MSRWLGIDFSGNVQMWRPSCRRSNVWIATLEERGELPRLVDLVPVQDLPGDGPPFARLAGHLRHCGANAIGIDAPFSLPARHLPPGGHARLLADVAALDQEGRPFPKGQRLVDYAIGQAPLLTAKPWRATERHWRRQRINVRSTLWNGARGGAAFTAACLALIAATGLPAWPWSRTGRPLLVEAFPAAQLVAWGLAAAGYDQSRERREAIVDGLRHRLTLPEALRERAQASPDALDAVLAAFAGRAVANDALEAPLPDDHADEGWIAVHA